MKVLERLKEGELTKIILNSDDLRKMNPSFPPLRIETRDLIYKIFPDYGINRTKDVESWFFEGILRIAIPKEKYLEIVESKKPLCLNLNLQEHLKNEGKHYKVIMD